MCADVEYHLERARSEQDIAYRTSHSGASGAHMQLSFLHLQRALLLQKVRTEPVGNVTPFLAPKVSRSEPDLFQVCMPGMDLQA